MTPAVGTAFGLGLGAGGISHPDAGLMSPAELVTPDDSWFASV